MITVLTGENDVLRQQALSRLIDSFVATYGDMALERLDGEEVGFERMHQAVQSLPFLSSRKLVVLRSPSANKDFTEQFATFVKGVAETNDVVLVEPKLDKRLAYYKQLKKVTEFKEFNVLDGVGLQRFASDYAKERGGSLNAADSRLLIDRVGTNQLTLQHEVDKLLAYNPKVTRASIEMLTDRTPQSSIFELLDAAFTGNALRASALYAEQRAQRIEPQQIMAMLVWQLHILAIVKTAGERSVDAIAQEAKISPFTIRKTQGLARQLPLTRLKGLITDFRVFDVRLKTEALNSDEVVQYYLLRLAQS